MVELALATEPLDPIVKLLAPNLTEPKVKSNLLFTVKLLFKIRSPEATFTITVSILLIRFPVF